MGEEQDGFLGNNVRSSENLSVVVFVSLCVMKTRDAKLPACSSNR